MKVQTLFAVLVLASAPAYADVQSDVDAQAVQDAQVVDVVEASDAPVASATDVTVAVPDAVGSVVVPPGDFGDAAKLVVQAVDYGKAGKWGLLVSVVVMLVVFVFRKFILKLIKDRALLKWVAFVLSILSYYAVALGQGYGFLTALFSTLIYGLPASAGAVGLWELGKNALPKPSDK